MEYYFYQLVYRDLKVPIEVVHRINQCSALPILMLAPEPQNCVSIKGAVPPYQPPLTGDTPLKSPPILISRPLGQRAAEKPSTFKAIFIGLSQAFGVLLNARNTLRNT